MAFSTANQCDYFTETDEPHSRMTARHTAKMLARSRREMIANELSRLAGDEYLEDIMQHMRHMEVGAHDEEAWRESRRVLTVGMAVLGRDAS